MPIPIQCPNCSATLRVPENAAGRTGRCPQCKHTMKIEFPSSTATTTPSIEPETPPRARPASPAPLPPAPTSNRPLPHDPFAHDEPKMTEHGDDYMLSHDDLSAVPTPPIAAQEEPKKKKKKKKQPERFSLTEFFGRVDPDIFKYIAAIIAFGIFFWFGKSAVGWLFYTRPDVIADNKWRNFKGGPGISVDMPGTPVMKNDNMAGVSFMMATISPSKNAIFSVAWILSELPPERAALSDEELLNDSCDGSVTMSGGIEDSRKSITLNGLKGKELVIWLPGSGGKLVSRTFITKNRKLAIAMCGGVGFYPGQEYVKRFLDSFSISDDNLSKPSASPFKPEPINAPTTDPPGADSPSTAWDQSDVHKVGRALLLYHDQHNKFPAPTINNKLSWRVAILPHLGEQGAALYQKFKLDEAWNSPHNIALLMHMPKEFATEDLNGPDRQKTRILAVVGPRCAFNEDGTSMTKIADGTTKTVLLVEGRYPVEWTRPDDYHVVEGAPLRPLGRENRSAVGVILADCSRSSLAADLAPEKWHAYFTIAGGEAP